MYYDIIGVCGNAHHFGNNNIIVITIIKVSGNQRYLRDGCSDGNFEQDLVD